MRKPSLAAAPPRRSSRVTKRNRCGLSSVATKAAASWRLSAAVRGWTWPFFDQGVDRTHRASAGRGRLPDLRHSLSGPSMDDTFGLQPAQPRVLLLRRQAGRRLDGHDPCHRSCSIEDEDGFTLLHPLEVIAELVFQISYLGLLHMGVIARSRKRATRDTRCAVPGPCWGLCLEAPQGGRWEGYGMAEAPEARVLR